MSETDRSSTSSGRGGFFTSGLAIGLALRRGVREHPSIEIVEDLYLTDLLTRDGRCVGAVGIDVYSGEAVRIKAKAVILGTGGFQPFSLKCTVSDMTGDGMGMALRAGLPVADMEFPLFIPGVCLSPPIHRGSIFPFLYQILTATFPDLPAPRMLNRAGEDIAAKIPPEHLALAEGSEWEKLVFTYWWGREIAEGRGSPNGGIYFSFRHVGPETFLRETRVLAEMMRLWYRDPWRYQGDDMSDLRDRALAGEPWEVGLGHEYSHGGILVNEKAETALPGLYAAGECSTGCFGANRVHDALVEMLVQGAVAGEEAARYAREAEEPSVDLDQVDAHMARICEPLERPVGPGPIEIRRALEAAADRGFGWLRDEAGLREALGRVERVRAEMLPRMSVHSSTRAYNPEWLESLGVENLALCLEAGLRAALERKESRGTHIRRDFPEVDHDAFLVRFTSRISDGRFELHRIRPRITRLSPPTGKVPDIMEYALSCEPRFKNAAGGGPWTPPAGTGKGGGETP